MGNWSGRINQIAGRDVIIYDVKRNICVYLFVYIFYLYLFDLAVRRRVLYRKVLTIFAVYYCIKKKHFDRDRNKSDVDFLFQVLSGPAIRTEWVKCISEYH